jgi:polyisoprenoid-binding protein YceI
MMMGKLTALLKTTAGKIGVGVLALLLIGGVWYYIAGGNTGSGKPLTVPTVTVAANTLEFKIDQSQSQVSFTIGEVLRGSPNTVVGKTNQVVGSIYVNKDHPTQVTVSDVAVNVAALATDDDLRNRTLRNSILQTNDPSNATTTFHPTAITGLPDTVSLGQTFSFKITGDLKIKGVTKPETFDATVTIVSESQMKGQAKVVVLYKDFGIGIPNVPQVAEVTDQVTLEIDFVANRA